MSLNDKILLGYYACAALGLFFGAALMRAYMMPKLAKSSKEAVDATQRDGREPDCEGCRYSTMNGCDCPILCESGEMWEQ